jgi:diguanylate cyclase (GGDEF)-like protein
MIYAQANRSLRHTFAGVALVLVLMLVIAWYGATALVLRPFRRLLEVADRVRAGDFGARCGLGSGSEELTRLGNALDTMVQELQNRDGQLKEIMRQLNEQAVTDQLTGLPNRRYLWDVLEAELLRSERKQVSLAVLMLDIDFFKEFNDRWGHEAGDLVLRNVAFALRQVVRGSDIVARHGGEEFVIVLPEATREVALVRAEELRAAVAALRLTYAGESLGAITVSVGVTVSAGPHESAEALLRAADNAMYEAKRAGRNRIVFGGA